MMDRSTAPDNNAVEISCLEECFRILFPCLTSEQNTVHPGILLHQSTNSEKQNTPLLKNKTHPVIEPENSLSLQSCKQSANIETVDYLEQPATQQEINRIGAELKALAKEKDQETLRQLYLKCMNQKKAVLNTQDFTMIDTQRNQLLLKKLITLQSKKYYVIYPSIILQWLLMSDDWYDKDSWYIYQQAREIRYRMLKEIDQKQLDISNIEKIKEIFEKKIEKITGIKVKFDEVNEKLETKLKTELKHAFFGTALEFLLTTTKHEQEALQRFAVKNTYDEESDFSVLIQQEAS